MNSRRSTFFLSLALILAASQGTASMWTDTTPGNIPEASGERHIVPDRARLVVLDRGALEVVLAGAPDEAASVEGISAPVITLPYPDGTDRVFELVLSPIMAPVLAERLPAIRTFILKGVGDDGGWGRGDLTPHGFHAMVWGIDGVLFIDPYRERDDRHHQAYFTHDYPRNPEKHKFHCSLGEHDDLPSPTVDPTPLAPRLTNGTHLRQYRLAVAASGEYTIFHGGTVNDGMAEIVTAMNRVNGVYERDLSIRMNLVANNDQVVYTNPDTDPYSNNDPFALLGENQTNLDSVIGSANYDMGHVFTTGGGGLASLGVICVNGSKARAETGLSSPTGDPFYIDFVAHEMGHQWDGNHSFNGNAGNCAGGNRNGSTAYEPGSGSTIMAYAGICGNQDLQNHSDDYFHVISLDEIVAYSTLGFGNSCAQVSATGNTPPTADAGADTTIPARTPFVLTGSAVDPDGDVLTYCWEQFDLGPAGAPTFDNGSSPIFRSWDPTLDPTRTFPRLQDLIVNITSIGEVLPTTDRNLSFRLTVRDNRSGGGGIDTDRVELEVDKDSGPFVVTSPTTAMTWDGEGPHTVAWDVAGTNLAPVSCASVDITLSTDGGFTYPVTLATQTANDGTEQVMISIQDTTQARVRIQCSTSIFFDISNSNFSISNAYTTVFNDGFETGTTEKWTDEVP